jgi:glutathionyl-hydroquinone reductase
VFCDSLTKEFQVGKAARRQLFFREIIKLTITTMALDKKELERIEYVFNERSDELAKAIALAFERMEERLTATESRVYQLIGNGVTDMNVAQRETEKKFAALGMEITGQISDVNNRLTELLSG